MTTKNDAQIDANLSPEDAFKAAVKEIIALAKEKGIGPQTPADVYQIQWWDNNMLRGGPVQRRTFVALQHAFVLYAAMDIMQTPSVRRHLNKIKEFSEAEGKFSGWSEKATVAEWHLRALFHEYFRQKEVLEFDDVVSTQVFKDYVTDIQGDEEVWDEKYIVQGLSAAAPFSINGNISFRPINMADIETYAHVNRFTLDELTKPTLRSENWVCTIVKSVPKADKQMPEFEIDDVITAINLMTPGRASFYLLDKTTKSPYSGAPRMSNSIKKHTSRFGDSISLTASGIENMDYLYKKISSLRGRQGFKNIELPLRRLRYASSRQDAGDHLVDCVIGMEYLLAPESGESSFKFRMRGAALLPDTFGKVESRIELMNGLYGKRSRIVHGGSDAQDQINEWSGKAEAVLRTLTLWYLETGANIGERKDIIAKLDAALITGGITVRDMPPPVL